MCKLAKVHTRRCEKTAKRRRDEAQALLLDGRTGIDSRVCLREDDANQVNNNSGIPPHRIRTASAPHPHRTEPHHTTPRTAYDFAQLSTKKLKNS